MNRPANTIVSHQARDGTATRTSECRFVPSSTASSNGSSLRRHLSSSCCRASLTSRSSTDDVFPQPRDPDEQSLKSHGAGHASADSQLLIGVNLWANAQWPATRRETPTAPPPVTTPRPGRARQAAGGASGPKAHPLAPGHPASSCFCSLLSTLLITHLQSSRGALTGSVILETVNGPVEPDDGTGQSYADECGERAGPVEEVAWPVHGERRGIHKQSAVWRGGARQSNVTIYSAVMLFSQ